MKKVKPENVKNRLGYIYLFNFPADDNDRTFSRLVKEDGLFGQGNGNFRWARTEKYDQEMFQHARVVVEQWTDEILKDAIGVSDARILVDTAECAGVDVMVMFGVRRRAAFHLYNNRISKFHELRMELATHGVLVPEEPEVKAVGTWTPQVAMLLLEVLQKQIDDMEYGLGRINDTTMKDALADIARRMLLVEANQPVKPTVKRKADPLDHLYVMLNGNATHVNALPPEERAQAIADSVKNT